MVLTEPTSERGDDRCDVVSTHQVLESQAPECKDDDDDDDDDIIIDQRNIITVNNSNNNRKTTAEATSK